MASTPTPGLIFVTAKPKLRSHNKSRRGCLACKARRVKCPENRPTCRTCARRGETCIYTDSSKGHEAVAQGDSADSKSRYVDHPEFDAAKDDNRSAVAISSRQKPQQLLPSTSDSTSGDLTGLGRNLTPNQLDWIDRDDARIIESVTYYNTVVTKAAPGFAPFQRILIPVEIWRDYMPKMLQHVWIALIKSIQANKAGVEPFSLNEVCRYRGKGLRELAEALPGATEDPYGMILSTVMTMMTADLYTGGPWTSHLEAARRIMVLKGGFRKCLDSIPSLRIIMFNYFIADVFTATTCDSRLIGSACSDMHAEYIEVLNDSDYDVFASSRPCPRMLIQAIARVNMLRASSNGRSTSLEEEREPNFQDLLNLINTFDPTSWTVAVSNFGKTLPQPAGDCPAERDVTALASYASCYHSATLLYFLLSCALPLTPQAKLRVHLASQNLSQHIRSLFETANTDSEGPLHTQLWKLLSWPILVGIYVRAGWDIGEEVKANLERLDRIVTVLASNRISDVRKFVRRVEAQRARRTTEWTWDDGFYSRCAFAL